MSVADLMKEPMVMTRDSQRTSDVIQTWLDDREPFIVVGPEGYLFTTDHISVSADEFGSFFFRLRQAQSSPRLL